ncbi:hypothetical protein [Pedobacter alpinus]|uniref:Uncharacterized protein n=1 Tax=Pedobacter alpinus TaxID=1590643 RepID=A0ABW5TPN3_9SPHI
MMNKAQILRKIGNIIQELNEQHEYLTSASKINLLELELFTANADFLIDHIEILKKLNERPEIKSIEDIVNAPKLIHEEATKSVDTVIKLTEEPQEEPKQKFNFSFEEPTEMVFDFEKRIAVEEVFDRDLSEAELKVLEEKKSEKDFSTLKTAQFPEIVEIKLKDDVVEEEKGPEPFLVIKDEPVMEAIKPEPAEPAVVEKIQQAEVIIQNEATPKIADNEIKRLTLNEMLSSKLNKTGLGAKNTQSTKKVDDLKAAISINDKMVFIKELFNGYNLAYSEAIEILNRFDNQEAADNFLQKNYAVKNDWESKQSTVNRFYEYLGKKFLS